jgi:hypothetical protein
MPDNRVLSAMIMRLNSWPWDSKKEFFMDIKCSVFIATSLDGFIARKNGEIDWLTGDGQTEGSEDYGYQEFFASVDTLVMGRNTYELVLTFPEWPTR